MGARVLRIYLKPIIWTQSFIDSVHGDAPFRGRPLIDGISNQSFKNWNQAGRAITYRRAEYPFVNFFVANNPFSDNVAGKGVPAMPPFSAWKAAIADLIGAIFFVAVLPAVLWAAANYETTLIVSMGRVQ